MKKSKLLLNAIFCYPILNLAKSLTTVWVTINGISNEKFAWIRKDSVRFKFHLSRLGLYYWTFSGEFETLNFSFVFSIFTKITKNICSTCCWEEAWCFENCYLIVKISFRELLRRNQVILPENENGMFY